MADKRYPRMINDHLAREDTVGDWDGQEALAAQQVNRIYRALYAAVEDDFADEEYFHEACHYVWDDWGSEEKLLTLTEEDIEEYVKKWFPR